MLYYVMKWLILSHSFNMDGRAASLTITDKIPFLLEKGVQPIVISGVQGTPDTRFPHYKILPWGPAGFLYDCRYAYPKFVRLCLRFLLLPFLLLEWFFSGLSNQSSWAIPAAYKGIRLIQAGGGSAEISTMYSTGGAWSAHFAAWMIKKYYRNRITWIAEIHDPMHLEKKTYRETYAVRTLEGLICRDADHVFWFTKAALASARRRHPALKGKGFTIYPGSLPPICRFIKTHEGYTDYLNITHFGILSDDRSLAPILKHLGEYPQIRIHVYGCQLDQASKKAMLAYGLTDKVIVHGRLETAEGVSGRERIMDIMKSSDVLLALHGNHEGCAEYIPSKLYDYFWTDRPLLALTYQNPELDSILQERGAYVCHEESISSVLKDLYRDWQAGQLRQTIYRPVSPEQAVNTILERLEIKG